MRPSLFLLCLIATVQASSWFGSSEPQPPYTAWSVSQLTSWLQAHNIPIPSKTPTQAELKALVQDNWNTVTTWTYDQYAMSQKYFADVRDDSFDAWDESRLREFLLSQGIVAPKGHKEQLVHLAKSQYRAYTNAASSFADRASTAVYGDSVHKATQSLSSIAAHATNSASRTLDSTKDYVYSTWDDNKLRSYLESKGVVVEERAKRSRNDLLGLMYDAYAKVTEPVYHAWSDSYLHNWLVSHNIISPTPPAPYSREYLLDKMQKFYYDTNESVYSTWSDSQLKEWLVANGVVKSNAQLKREKMQKLIEDNYLTAHSTVASAWSDSQLRDYLVEHGYIDNRSAAQKKRDDLVKLFQDKYHSAVTPSYLSWPDARLRAYLRLLQETRIRWVETKTSSEAIWARVRDIVGGVEGGIEAASAMGSSAIVSGRIANAAAGSAKRAAKEKVEEGKRYAGETYDNVKESAGRQYSEAEKEYEGAKERAYSKGQGTKEKLGEKIKAAGEKVMGSGDRIKTEL
ncbi:hypothetical protein C0993_007356 [Termitomyces sp. T159_Od127]|nr:hypothetical protein C0993_007356 [Termitomyces sp. T159_Od127]